MHSRLRYHFPLLLTTALIFAAEPSVDSPPQWDFPTLRGTIESSDGVFVVDTGATGGFRMDPFQQHYRAGLFTFWDRGKYFETDYTLSRHLGTTTESKIRSQVAVPFLDTETLGQLYGYGAYTYDLLDSNWTPSTGISLFRDGKTLEELNIDIRSGFNGAPTEITPVFSVPLPLPLP